MFTRDFSDHPPGWHVWLPSVLVGLALWVPLPFGSNRPWVWHLPGIIAGAGMMAVLARRDVPVRLQHSLFLFSGVLAWMLLQALPIWPGAVVSYPVMGSLVPLAVQPLTAVEHALRLASLGGVFFLGFVLARDTADGAVRVLRGMAVGGLIWALVSILLETLLPGRLLVLWEKEAYTGVLTGPFINRNAAACFFGLVCLVVLGSADRMSGLYRFAMVSVPFVAVLMTGSRGGFAALVVALVVLVWLRRPQHKDSARMLSLLLILILVSGRVVTDRWLATDLDHVDRFHVWDCVIRGIADQWWSGVGGGGFDHIFTSWRDIATVQHWDRAHNMYLELAVEIGIPALLVLAFVVLGQARICWRQARAVRTDPAPAVGISALALAAVQGLVDFAPQIPANSLWVALLLGLGCGTQGHRFRKGRSARQGATVQGPGLVHGQGSGQSRAIPPP